MFWSTCLALCLIGSCSGGLLRVPKVYNAIINSNDNLTPSRAFPLIQPVVHETALGYPLSPPLIYHQELKPSSHPGLDEINIPKPVDPNRPQMENKAQPDDSSKPDQKDQSQKPPQGPPKENPLKLNQFGLPPSLVPVSQYSPRLTYQYDPYHYNPYYPDPFNNIILPYGNPYNPYYPSPFAQSPFNPYVVHTPFYSIPPNQQQGVPGNNPPSWPDQNWDPQQQQGEQQPEQTNPNQQPQQQQLQPQQPNQQGFPPSALSVKNNSNKNSNIPDVPPPPLPVGGLKYDNSKKTS